ncbi:hypothetical protein DAEQUDRAFT_739103 [Daedalea quercina L-15889]|uniref:BTB domain-containing protein n=1 Tax=Daedalea quercina L-15889 TaxID=1314783 RepID=A0A165P7A9_9APHY|nr:hypothetical protein DAEQUDRAFT_739103 [Daedalea quercina L-15889]
MTRCKGPNPHPLKGWARADVVVRSSDGVAFHVLRVLFGFASPVLAEMLSKLDKGVPSSTETNGSRTKTVTALGLPEDERTFALPSLLRKYDVPRAPDWAKCTCLAVASTWPVRVYVIASRYGLRLEPFGRVRKTVDWRSWMEIVTEIVGKLAQIQLSSSSDIVLWSRPVATVRSACSSVQWFGEPGEWFQCPLTYFQYSGEHRYLAIDTRFVAPRGKRAVGGVSKICVCPERARYSWALDHIMTSPEIPIAPPAPLSSPSTPSSRPTLDLVAARNEIMTHENAPLKTAPYPFDNVYSDADVILRTPDGTRFYVHKAILRIASAFFAELFSLPQPPSLDSTSGEGPACPEIPIIPITEDSNTIERLLRMYYPIQRPEVSNFESLAPVLGAAMKYDMPVVTDILTRSLSRRTATHPLQVFAIAYKLDLQDLGEDAIHEFVGWNIGHPFETRSPLLASETSSTYQRSHPVDEYTQAMDDIPAATYYRLLEHHASTTADLFSSKGAKAAAKLIVSRPRDQEHPREPQPVSGRLPHPFQDPARADTVIQSSDHSDFYVNRSLLAFASPLFAQLLAPSSTTSAFGSSDTAPGSPVGRELHRFPEDSQTLSKLLQLSYPMPDPEVTDSEPIFSEARLKRALSLLEAAKKYEVPRAITFAKRACVEAAKANPVQLYLIATRYSWDDVARHAAMQAIYETSDRYLPEMEHASAAAYRRLLVYRRKCRDIILSGTDPTPPGSPASWGAAVIPAASPAHVAYWSESSWLTHPAEARFWFRLHEYASQHIGLWCGDNEPVVFMDVEAILPSSVVNDTDRAMRGSSKDGVVTTPLTPRPPRQSNQEELERIAQALVKVDRQLSGGIEPSDLAIECHQGDQHLLASGGNRVIHAAACTVYNTRIDMNEQPPMEDQAVEATMNMTTDASLAAATTSQLPVIEAQGGMESGEGCPPKCASVTKAAVAPFDNHYGDADVILRSVNGTDFYVHKNVLRIASSFFADMFSLPQPVYDSASDGDIATGVSDRPSGVPIVSVSENSQVLEDILRMCYPVEKPNLDSVQVISPLLEVAMKYQMPEATNVMMRQLMTLCCSQPLDVFAEACKRDLEEVAAHAAQAFSAPLVVIQETEKDVPAHAIDAFTSHMDAHHEGCGTVRSTLSSHPFRDVIRADTIVRSSDGIDFYVLRAFVGFASPVLAPLLFGEVTSGSDAQGICPEGRNRLLDLPEDGRTLASLFQLCYPMPDPDIEDESDNEKLCDAYRLLEAAKKYAVARAAEFAKRRCIEAMAANPVRLYLVASRYGWEDAMKETAWRAVYETSDVHVPEMATASAATYRRLLVYRQKCRDIILAHRQSSRSKQSEKTSYWSKDSWLGGSTGEARFWLALHRNVQEEAAAGHSPPRFDADIVLPKSIIQVDNTSSTEVSSFSGRGHAHGRRFGISGSSIWALSRETVINIAEALAKVEF